MIEEETPDGKDILIYDIGKPEDLDQVAQFAAEHFFNSSPIIELASIDEFSSQAERFAARKERLQKCFAHPTSMTVREKSTGQLVAFTAAMLLLEDTSTIANNNDQTNVGWLVKAIGDELNKGVNLYARYKTNRILYLWIASIREDYRRHRIFGNNATLALWGHIIYNQKAGAVKTETYSHYAEKVLRGIAQWEVIKSIDYNEFKLPNGIRPLAGLDFGVHRTARLLAVRVPSQEMDEIIVAGNEIIVIPKSRM